MSPPPRFEKCSIAMLKARFIERLEIAGSGKAFKMSVHLTVAPSRLVLLGPSALRRINS